MSKQFMNKCYQCKYRGDVPGSAHSSCHHPDIPKLTPLAELFGIMGRMPMTLNSEKLAIKGNDHGIASGWFFWPLNFDPVWLENCNGFTPKEEACPTKQQPNVETEKRSA